jgi:hypothetical protein
MTTACSSPWPHIVIDDFMPEYMIQYHLKKAQEVDSGDLVGRKILDYDPMPRVADLLEKFSIRRQYNELGKFIHYASTKDNIVHPMHTDAAFKIMSAVLYLGPEHNYGTRLYENPDSPCVKEVEWKPNRLFVFCGTNYTWHDYRSTDTRYTLNYFLVDPTIIENPQYKQGII